MPSNLRHTPFWHYLFRYWKYTLLIVGGNLLSYAAASLKWHCEAWFSQFMYQRGWTMGYFQIGAGEGMPDFQLEWYAQVAVALASVTIAIAVEFLLVRLGYAIFCRRFKFRPRQLLRTWAVASVAIAPLYLLFSVPIALSLMYLQRRAITGAGEIDIIWWPTCFLLAPALLNRLLVRRRSRVLTPRCVRCGYQLRGLSQAICPECGKRLGARAVNPTIATEANQALPHKG